MSDRGDEDNGRHSRNGSLSGQSDDDTRIVTYKSRSKEESKSPSGSPSKMKYRSRSRSRSHHRSRRSRSHRRSRSRSLGKYRSSRYSRSFSRSRSASYSPYRGSSRRYRSRSHSPMSSRRRHLGTRENPKPDKCLGVFGLSIYTTENQLHHIFGKFGSVNKVQVVIDAKSGRSRGFAFVYFDSIDDAKSAKENCSGMEIDGRKIRVDFSITKRAHTPTPGIYMGKPTYSSDVRWRGEDDYYGGGGGGGGGRRYDRYSRRSPSPYSRSRRRYDRSRSRSYTPRRYY